ncbi:hypothetical protein LCGC14_1118980 [marine sediment metagenome]|uniref:Uncharacterized protein n=1 Tax=marine sediment metagenome TaxID=412755 RepID=A0A0F9M9E1_9ZZZZ
MTSYTHTPTANVWAARDVNNTKEDTHITTRDVTSIHVITKDGEIVEVDPESMVVIRYENG